MQMCAVAGDVGIDSIVDWKLASSQFLHTHFGNTMSAGSLSFDRLIFIDYWLAMHGWGRRGPERRALSLGVHGSVQIFRGMRVVFLAFDSKRVPLIETQSLRSKNAGLSDWPGQG